MKDRSCKLGTFPPVPRWACCGLAFVLDPEHRELSMKSATCVLGEIASVSLGFKSLQNQFFYLSQERIKQFGIDEGHLKPIIKMKDLNLGRYLQKAKPSQWLFYCPNDEKELRKL